MEGTRTYPAFHSSVPLQCVQAALLCRECLQGEDGELQKENLIRVRSQFRYRQHPITRYPVNRLRRLGSPLGVTNALILKSSRETSSRKSRHI